MIYATREPAGDIQRVMRHLREHAGALGIDGGRIGILACSANVAVALSALMTGSIASCAALLYGLTLDLDGSSDVAAASREFGFVNACAGTSVSDVADDVPLCVVRAGREHFAGLNKALDRFVTAAVARNLPITSINHPTGPHGFDLEEDSEVSRRIIKHVLSFLSLQLEVG